MPLDPDIQKRRFDPLSISGFADAVAAERLVRDAAFIVDRESIAGFEVYPMTLRHYLALRIQSNPLLIKERPTLEQLAQFIWVVSVDYSAGNQVKWFNRKFSGMIDPREPRIRTSRAMARWALAFMAAADLRETTISAAFEYVRESLMDAPRGGQGFHASYYSDACFWCSLMHRERGMTESDVLDTSLKKLFQYYREHKHRKDGQACMFNPSDDVKARWQEKQSKAMRQN